MAKAIADVTVTVITNTVNITCKNTSAHYLSVIWVCKIIYVSTCGIF